MSEINPPSWLNVEFHAAWNDAVQKCNGAEGRAILVTEYFGVLQRLRQTTAQLEKDGIMLASKRSGLQHQHPLLKFEKDLRSQALKYATALGLHYVRSTPSPLEKLCEWTE
jgi:phage terminase small subunit